MSAFDQSVSTPVTSLPDPLQLFAISRLDQFGMLRHLLFQESQKAEHDRIDFVALHGAAATGFSGDQHLPSFDIDRAGLFDFQANSLRGPFCGAYTESFELFGEMFAGMNGTASHNVPHQW